jgi:hypothetical protein
MQNRQIGEERFFDTPVAKLKEGRKLLRVCECFSEEDVNNVILLYLRIYNTMRREQETWTR